MESIPGSPPDSPMLPNDEKSSEPFLPKKLPNDRRPRRQSTLGSGYQRRQSTFTSARKHSVVSAGNQRRASFATIPEAKGASKTLNKIYYLFFIT